MYRLLDHFNYLLRFSAKIKIYAYDLYSKNTVKHGHGISYIHQWKALKSFFAIRKCERSYIQHRERGRQEKSFKNNHQSRDMD